jgi:hypothetical protein
LVLGVFVGTLGTLEYIVRFADREKILQVLLDSLPWVELEVNTAEGTRRFRATPIE